MRVRLAMVSIPGTDNIRLEPKVFSVSDAGEAGFDFYVTGQYLTITGHQQYIIKRKAFTEKFLTGFGGFMAGIAA